MSKILEKKITRRTFLKSSAATAAGVAAVAAVGDKLFGGPVSSLIESAEAATPEITEDKWVRTACRMCREHDPIQVHVVNGVAVKIDGIPGEPHTQGRICPRGQAGIMNLYNPWRVKTPMKRTNPEKGLGIDPKWQEITWDEALDIVSSKIKEAVAKDPRRFAFATTFGSVLMYGAPVGMAWGTPNAIGWGPGEICGGGFHLAEMRLVHEQFSYIDLDRCKYAISWGANDRLVTKCYPAAMRGMVHAWDNGLRTVSIDPVLGYDARKATEWVPIRPGTDQALALAMAYVMVFEESLYDISFLKINTNAPYLLDNNGNYVRSKTAMYEDTIRKQTLGKPLIWDAVDGKAKEFDDPSIKDFALEGSYTVDGVSCQTVFEVFKAFLKQYTPEWAEPITTVPAATTRRLAREFGESAQIGASIKITEGGATYEVPFRPVAIGIGTGAQGHYHAALASRAVYLPSLLVGAFNSAGNLKGSEGVNSNPVAGPDGVIAPYQFSVYSFNYPPNKLDQMDAHPLAHSGGSHVAYGILHGKEHGINYDVDVLGINFTNPLKNMYNPGIVEEAFKKIPFVFSLAYHFDEPTEMSDVILPEPSYLERWELISIRTAKHQFTGWADYAKNWRHIRQPVVERLYNTKDAMETLTELAVRSGVLGKWNNALTQLLRLNDLNKLEPDKQYSWTDVMDRALKSQFDEDHGLEWFKENGFNGWPAKLSDYFPYIKQPRTRLPIYDEYIKWAGEQYQRDAAAAGVHLSQAVLGEFDPLPTWRGRGPLDECSPEFDLYGVKYPEPFQAMTMAMDNPWYVEYEGLFEPYAMRILVNEETAKSKGINNGDEIVVESPYGRVTGEAKLSQTIHPECVGIPGAYGNQSINLAPSARLGPHFNTLISSDIETLDPLGGNVETTPPVKIYKA